MSGHLYEDGSRLAALPHLSSLLLALATIVVVGQPFGWIGFLLPLGPLLTAGIARVLGRAPNPTWRFALAFSLMCAVLIGGGWLLLWAAEPVPALGLVFPFGLLAFFLGLVNFVLISISRSFRAWKAIPLDYPWIPSWLERPLGLTPMMKEM